MRECEVMDNMLEVMERRFFGKYRGIVVQNEDPENSGRQRTSPGTERASDPGRQWGTTSASSLSHAGGCLEPDPLYNRRLARAGDCLDVRANPQRNGAVTEAIRIHTVESKASPSRPSSATSSFSAREALRDVGQEGAGDDWK